jgi:IS5 family transposase
VAVGEKAKPDIAIPVFGCKNHIGIDRRQGRICTLLVVDAAAHDGARLREGLVDRTNFASDVWADTAYRSGENERFLSAVGKVSRIHRKKPKGKPMPWHTARANAAKSVVRSRFEHVFTEQKARMGLVVRTVRIARARTKIGLANLAWKMKRLVWLQGTTAPL